MIPQPPRLAPLALALIALALRAPTAGAQVVFQEPDLYLGSAPMTGLALGDVNEDGFLDVVTTPASATFFEPNSYQVLLGQGDGTLEPFSTVPFAAAPCVSLHLVDWNDDDDLDIVAACSTGGNQTITVALGDGDGTFGISTQTTGVDSCVDMAIADINFDDLPDTVTVTSGFTPFFPPDIRARVSLTNGSFQNVTLPTNTTPVECALGQVGPGDNGDIVVVGTDGTIESFLYNGGSNFSSPVTTTTSTSPLDMILVPLDRDDRLDLVLTDTVSDTVVSFLNNGNGTFTQVGSVAAGTNVFGLVAGDMDGDALPDVVVSSGASNDLHVLRNNGDGTLTRIVSVSNVTGPISPQVGDLDGDGDLEIVASSQDVEDRVAVLVNRTYLPGEPWLDRGNALFGTNGYPIQICTGTLLEGDPFTFEVSNALPDGTAFLVLGLSELNAPFKLGVMVPDIDVFLKPIFIDANGDILLGGIWGPGLPTGFQFWLQYWFADAGGPAGFGGTNAVRATGP